MKIIKPKKLQKGDTIGIIAISGKIKEIERIEKAKAFFEEEGFNVIISDTCKNSHRYMAGKNDEECINTFHDFFQNKKIDAIVCARGGYGTLRLLDKINWNIVRENPKIFAGYSDITNLLTMIYKNTGLITFHSAMPNGDFSFEIEEYTKTSFFNTLQGRSLCYHAINNHCYNNGVAEGILWGGNLSTLVSLCGRDFVPNKKIILFLEDLNEPAYKIDKMLTQLFSVSTLRKKTKGIAIGEFQNIENKDYLKEIIEELSKELNIPICDGFKFTHGKIKDTIPVGCEVIFDSEQGLLITKDKYTN